jgi:V/A-type H+-transporting ATPase subunit C
VYGLLADSYARQPTLFTLERQIDLFYYFQIQKAIKKIKSKKSREAAADIIGTEIDLFNILWVYRIKQYYTVHSEQIYAYLVPAGRLLNTDALRRIVESEDTDALKEEAAEGPYRNVFGDFSSPERSVEAAKKRKYTAEIRKDPETLVAPVGYLFDKERELFNITSAIEGVRYGLKPDEITNMLFI